MTFQFWITIRGVRRWNKRRISHGLRINRAVSKTNRWSPMSNCRKKYDAVQRGPAATRLRRLATVLSKIPPEPGHQEKLLQRILVFLGQHTLDVVVTPKEFFDVVLWPRPKSDRDDHAQRAKRAARCPKFVPFIDRADHWLAGRRVISGDADFVHEVGHRWIARPVRGRRNRAGDCLFSDQSHRRQRT